MNLVIKPKKSSQEIVCVTPQSAGWRYVSFSAYQLAPGQSLTLCDDTRELCAVVLTGIVSAKTKHLAWKEIGGAQERF
jgi:5-deoxy-glucuronate isomerase